MSDIASIEEVQAMLDDAGPAAAEQDDFAM